MLDPDNVERVFDERMRVFGQLYNKPSTDHAVDHRYKRYFEKMPDFTYHHTSKKTAGQAVAENESTGTSLAFQGTMRVCSSYPFFNATLAYPFFTCISLLQRNTCISLLQRNTCISLLVC